MTNEKKKKKKKKKERKLPANGEAIGHLQLPRAIIWQRAKHSSTSVSSSSSLFCFPKQAKPSTKFTFTEIALRFTRSTICSWSGRTRPADRGTMHRWWRATHRRPKEPCQIRPIFKIKISKKISGVQKLKKRKEKKRKEKKKEEQDYRVDRSAEPVQAFSQSLM